MKNCKKSLNYSYSKGMARRAWSQIMRSMNEWCKANYIYKERQSKTFLYFTKFKKMQNEHSVKFKHRNNWKRHQSIINNTNQFKKWWCCQISSWTTSSISECSQGLVSQSGCQHTQINVLNLKHDTHDNVPSSVC